MYLFFFHVGVTFPQPAVPAGSRQGGECTKIQRSHSRDWARHLQKRNLLVCWSKLKRKAVQLNLHNAVYNRERPEETQETCNYLLKIMCSWLWRNRILKVINTGNGKMHLWSDCWGEDWEFGSGHVRLCPLVDWITSRSVSCILICHCCVGVVSLRNNISCWINNCSMMIA